MKDDFYNFLDGSITCGGCDKKVRGWSILFHWFFHPLTHYPMNTCCEKCTYYAVIAPEKREHQLHGTEFCGDKNCQCHQEKHTPESFNKEAEVRVGKILKEHAGWDQEKPTHEIGWEAGLQFEVMENYLMCAKMEYAALDKTAHMEEMRDHFEKLKAFIGSLLTHQKESIVDALETKQQQCGFCDGKCDIDIRNETIKEAIEIARGV